MKLRFLLVFLTLLPISLPAQSAPETGKPFVVEYYYKAKWGYADEFLQLFKKNHYPLLKKQLWPDQAAYAKEEQRRFEILAGHWDVPIKSVELEAK